MAWAKARSVDAASRCTAGFSEKRVSEMQLKMATSSALAERSS